MTPLARRRVIAILLAASCLAGPTTTERPAVAATSATIRLCDVTIELLYADDSGGVNRELIRDWVVASASALRAYYGRFPVARVRIQVEARDGRGAQSGTTYGRNDGLIRVDVGRDSSRADLARDWIMTHEMVHLAMPHLDDQHVWLEEGAATYVEPIARVHAGLLTDATIWRDMWEGMPKGLPAAGDAGLDHTHTWGRTYWGGALFFLQADVRIRERTGNRMGLQDALGAIVASGENRDSQRDVRRTLAAGDKATGTTVLLELYDEMRATPVAPDIDRLWERLGVKVFPDRVEFNDTAPLAPVRRAITARRKPDSC